MVAVKRTKDIQAHQDKLDKIAHKSKCKTGAQVELFEISNKKFSQLSGPQKDRLLKAIALRMELIEPDD